MNCTVRLSWRHDLDLIALAKHPDFEFAKYMKMSLIAFARGDKGFFISPPERQVQYQEQLDNTTIHFRLSSDKEADVIEMIHNMREGYRNSAMKNIFRSFLKYVYMNPYFYNSEYGNVKIHAFHSSRNNSYDATVTSHPPYVPKSVPKFVEDIRNKAIVESSNNPNVAAVTPKENLGATVESTNIPNVTTVTPEKNLDVMMGETTINPPKTQQVPEFMDTVVSSPTTPANYSIADAVEQKITNNRQNEQSNQNVPNMQVGTQPVQNMHNTQPVQSSQPPQPQNPNPMGFNDGFNGDNLTNVVPNNTSNEPVPANEQFDNVGFGGFNEGSNADAEDDDDSLFAMFGNMISDSGGV